MVAELVLKRDEEPKMLFLSGTWLLSETQNLANLDKASFVDCEKMSMVPIHIVQGGRRNRAKWIFEALSF